MLNIDPDNPNSINATTLDAEQKACMENAAAPLEFNSPLAPDREYSVIRYGADPVIYINILSQEADDPNAMLEPHALSLHQAQQLCADLSLALMAGGSEISEAALKFELMLAQLESQTEQIKKLEADLQELLPLISERVSGG